MSRIPIVAIVDDDEAIRDALSELLMVEGFACQPFENALAFIAEIGRSSFDCLITDMRMPGMNGLDLLEHLHARGENLPAIVLTSVVDDQSRTRSLGVGAQAWLGKPVADSVLLHALRRALQDKGVDLPQEPDA
ncbi:response regulator [Sphingobium sp. BYY-5]|uniref:response regulator transcription factor n=1 Tax=Sphingobium sp. BYY-5 TaxID=2926400 RepID=UPI001FA7AA05|nr:response regulator [Sphingobium sp. BYY-5]MCI4590828.1 response regulator [Sphingobium sp. BYY-5]